MPSFLGEKSHINNTALLGSQCISERSKRRDFLALVFISKSISKKLLISMKITFKHGVILYRG